MLFEILHPVGRPRRILGNTLPRVLKLAVPANVGYEHRTGGICQTLVIMSSFMERNIVSAASAFYAGSSHDFWYYAPVLLMQCIQESR